MRGSAVGQNSLPGAHQRFGEKFWTTSDVFLPAKKFVFCSDLFCKGIFFPLKMLTILLFKIEILIHSPGKVHSQSHCTSTTVLLLWRRQYHAFIHSFIFHTHIIPELRVMGFFHCQSSFNTFTLPKTQVHFFLSVFHYNISIQCIFSHILICFKLFFFHLSMYWKGSNACTWRGHPLEVSTSFEHF